MNVIEGNIQHRRPGLVFGNEIGRNNNSSTTRLNTDIVVQVKRTSENNSPTHLEMTGQYASIK